MKYNNHAWCRESGFANRIRQARENAGLTRFQVATMVCTCQEYIYKMECGESVPNIKRVAELADLYGVSIDYLCKGVG